MSSSIDITIASAELASVSRWKTMDKDTMGSDHVPIISKFGRCLIEEPVNISLRLNYQRANGTKFEENVNLDLSTADSEKGGGEWKSSLTEVMWSAAAKAIPKKNFLQRGTMDPWWIEE